MSQYRTSRNWGQIEDPEQFQQEPDDSNCTVRAGGHPLSVSTEDSALGTPWGWGAPSKPASQLGRGKMGSSQQGKQPRTGTVCPGWPCQERDGGSRSPGRLGVTGQARSQIDGIENLHWVEACAQVQENKEASTEQLPGRPQGAWGRVRSPAALAGRHPFAAQVGGPGPPLPSPLPWMVLALPFSAGVVAVNE